MGISCTHSPLIFHTISVVSDFFRDLNLVYTYHSLWVFHFFFIFFFGFVVSHFAFIFLDWWGVFRWLVGRGWGGGWEGRT